jgi:hypothetical protein
MRIIGTSRSTAASPAPIATTSRWRARGAEREVPLRPAVANEHLGVEMRRQLVEDLLYKFDFGG